MKLMLTSLLAIYLATGASVARADDPERQYTFAWQFEEGSELAPRGGTSKGPEVNLVDEPTASWQRLTEPGLSKIERDRRAILAMAGAYRTSFDFIETEGYTADFAVSKPYQSWGTEYVYVVADEPGFISLQHILVMTIKGDDGTLSDPMVVKHWRQDWRYQDRDLHVFTGDRTWKQQRLSRRDVNGKWSQTVFQVDDSPRYEAVGAWKHYANYSSWTSGETWRPLPRREFSVRDDYQTLVGTNRHTIVPTGWIHHEDNLKVRLEGTEMADDNPIVARELGLNRYERIEGYDFSAGDTFWSRTGPFWEDVRAAWRQIYEENETFSLRARVDEKPLFMWMFSYAADIESTGRYDTAAGRAYIADTLERFIK